MNPRCDQCDSLYINGIYCHEIGCPNSEKYNTEEERWETVVDDGMYDGNLADMYDYSRFGLWEPNK